MEELFWVPMASSKAALIIYNEGVSPGMDACGTGTSALSDSSLG